MWFFLKFFLFINFIFHNYGASCINSIDIDETKTYVWGPGLNPSYIVLRARYFFLQLVDKNGNNVTESPSKALVSSEIFGETRNGVPCQIWTQVLDCKDGSFIVRYRLYNTCYNLNINVRVKNQIVNLKHLNFKGPIYEEECYCPTPIEIWLLKNDCLKTYKSVKKNLRLFPSVNFDDVRTKIIDRYNRPNSISICHYVVKSNKIFRQCYGHHVGFKTFVDEIFLSLSRKLILPDIEFFINLGDWPLVPKTHEIYPIFSWCGSDDHNDIILPTYDITKSSIEAMGSVSMDILSVQGSTNLPWKKKKEKIFWRGRDSRRERLRLIDIAKKNPDLFNASITNFFFFQDEIHKYGPSSKHISFFEFFEYKYQLNIDGSVAAYRLPYLLAGDSLVFKQNSKYFEYFYHDLERGKHYVPVKSDLSDIVDQVKWAIKHDEEAHKISKQARKYVRENLMPQDIFCYHAYLTQEWSKRLKSDIKIFPSMEEVLKPKHDCECAENREMNEKNEL